MNSFVLIHNLLTIIHNQFEKLYKWRNTTSKKDQNIDVFIKRRQNQIKKEQNNLEVIKKQIEKTQEEVILKEKERDSQTGKTRNVSEKDILDLNKNLELFKEKQDLIINYINYLQLLLDAYNEYKKAMESQISPHKEVHLLKEISNNLVNVYQQKNLIEEWDKAHLPKSFFTKMFYKFFK